MTTRRDLASMVEYMHGTPIQRAVADKLDHEEVVIAPKQKEPPMEIIDIDEARDRIKKLEEELRKSQQLHATARFERDAAAKDCDEARQENIALKLLRDSLEKECVDLRADVVPTQRENERLRKDLAFNTQTMIGTRDECEALHKRVAHYKAKCKRAGIYIAGMKAAPVHVLGETAKEAPAPAIGPLIVKVGMKLQVKRTNRIYLVGTTEYDKQVVLWDTHTARLVPVRGGLHSDLCAYGKDQYPLTRWFNNIEAQADKWEIL